MKKIIKRKKCLSRAFSKQNSCAEIDLKTLPTAFSLLEMAIVITIIGILSAMYFKGGSYFAVAKKAKAAQQTKNSEIAAIPNMVLWLDAVSPDSFNVADTQLVNGQAISSWKDVNSNLPSKFRISALQPTAAAMPTYASSGINGIPALNFDGISDFLLINSTILSQTDFTIFVVDQRGKSSAGFLIGTANFVSGNYKDIALGYGNDTTTNSVMNFAPNSPSSSGVLVNNVISKFGSTVSRIHSAIRSSNKGSFYYINGNLTGSNITLEGKIQIDIAFSNIGIGRHNTNSTQVNYYLGRIGEIIVYTRALKNSERAVVEKYLSNKWLIK